MSTFMLMLAVAYNRMKNVIQNEDKLPSKAVMPHRDSPNDGGDTGDGLQVIGIP